MDGRAVSDAWGSVALRGILAILFGIAAVFWPGITLLTFVYLFAGFVLASGVVALVAGLTNIYNNDMSFVTRLLSVVLGIAEIGVGVYLLRHTAVSFATLILIVGFILIARGVVELFNGLFEAGSAMYKTVMILGGVVTAAAGILLLFQPESAGIAFVWILGIYALISGPLLLALAFDMKNSLPEEVERGTRRARRT